ncbi:MAG: MotA/TolQ/ExbB proton channel family protein [Verrucomicrobiales bacterium]|jgi:biopolymer transport protein ExbB|nr:MotA/TolQ/ExbB proton channel family protein [Verrucomicrobiales bacterium]
MIELFLKGGPIMWPILALSIVTVGVIIERGIFMLAQSARRDNTAVQNIFHLAEQHDIAAAIRAGERSADLVARVLVEGLKHRETSLTETMLEAASAELDRNNRGLVVLDTAVTLGPLLGLLGTVIGMIRAFNVVGGGAIADNELAITGSISECLIAVCFGLAVAIIAIVPLNWLSSRLEKIRRRLESAMTRLETLVKAGA